MKVVVDTSVFVLGILNPDGKPAAIINPILLKKTEILYDNRIIKEYRNVLLRDKFGFTKELVDTLIEFIKKEGKFIIAEPIKTNFSDESDKKFLEVALSGNADYLITGNIKDFPVLDFIVLPSDFLKFYHF